MTYLSQLSIIKIGDDTFFYMSGAVFTSVDYILLSIDTIYLPISWKCNHRLSRFLFSLCNNKKKSLLICED